MSQQGPQRPHQPIGLEWDANPYICSLEGIANNFWKDVKDTVFPQCESDNKFNSGNRADCKRGAEDYVTKRGNDWAKKSECEDFGKRTVSDIADMRCPREIPVAVVRMNSQKLLSPKCEAWAKDACKIEVENQIQYRLNQGTKCKNKGLQQRCDKEVKKRVEDAKLP